LSGETRTRWGTRAARLYDEAYAERYRAHDEAPAPGAAAARLGAWLQALCERFPAPIEALDLGCGTGRYFGALRNVRRLVGIDASHPMLEWARRPVGGAAMTPGGRGFLEHAANSARVGIVTRAARADVDALIRLSGLDVPFAVVVSGDDVLDAKPAVEGYRIALERLSRLRPVNPANVISLEDAGDGIRAAHFAKVRCIAVGDVPAHVAIEADAYVATLEGHTLASLDMLSRPGRERVQ